MIGNSLPDTLESKVISFYCRPVFHQYKLERRNWSLPPFGRCRAPVNVKLCSFDHAFFLSCLFPTETICISQTCLNCCEIVTLSKPFYYLGAEALQSHVIREEVHLGRWCYSYLLLWMAGQNKCNYYTVH